MSCISACNSDNWCGYCLERHVRLIIWLHGNRENARELEKKEREIQYTKKKTELNTQALDDQVFWGYTKEWQTYKITPQKYKMAQSLVPPVWDQQQHVLIAEITGVTLERSR